MVGDRSFDEFKKILTVELIELFMSYWTVEQVPNTWTDVRISRKNRANRKANG